MPAETDRQREREKGRGTGRKMERGYIKLHALNR